MTDDDEQRQLEQLHAQLIEEFGPVVGEEVVNDRFSAAVGQFDDARVRTFVPLLTNRLARRELASAGPG